MKEIRDLDFFLDNFDDFDLKEQELIKKIGSQTLIEKVLSQRRSAASKIMALQAIAEVRPDRSDVLKIVEQIIADRRELLEVRVEAVKTMAKYIGHIRDLGGDVRRTLERATKEPEQKVSLAAKRALAFKEV